MIDMPRQHYQVIDELSEQYFYMRIVHLFLLSIWSSYIKQECNHQKCLQFLVDKILIIFKVCGKYVLIVVVVKMKRLHIKGLFHLLTGCVVWQLFTHLELYPSP